MSDGEINLILSHIWFAGSMGQPLGLTCYLMFGLGVLLLFVSVMQRRWK